MKKLYIIISLILLTTLSACTKNNISEDGICSRYDKDTNYCSIGYDEYFDTYISLSFYIDNSIDYLAILDDVKDILIQYNELFDKYHSYQDDYDETLRNINYINNYPTETIVIDPIIVDVINFSLENEDSVNGLFNIALDPVTSIWHDFRDNCNVHSICELPKIENLTNASNLIDSSNIMLDIENSTITMTEGMSIDLGGIAKGALTKQLNDYLQTHDIDSYILNAGGSNVIISGTHPKGRDFTVGIIDPTNTNNYYSIVSIPDGFSIVTSGDYQNYYIVDNKLYHHIIDPNTLYPSVYSRSVSVIYHDSLAADFYSTSLFLMSIEDGMEFVNNVDGLEAIWYEDNESIYFSDHFQEKYLIQLN